MIAYEDLKIANLVKNHKLAKSISDASWGLFLALVRYYGTLASVPVVAVSPRFTTQDCSGCGFRVQKSLSQRTHICPDCGLIARPGLERGAQYPAGCLGSVGSQEPYRRAGGNGSRAKCDKTLLDKPPRRTVFARARGIRVG